MDDWLLLSLLLYLLVWSSYKQLSHWTSSWFTFVFVAFNIEISFKLFIFVCCSYLLVTPWQIESVVITITGHLILQIQSPKVWGRPLSCEFTFWIYNAGWIVTFYLENNWRADVDGVHSSAYTFVLFHGDRVLNDIVKSKHSIYHHVRNLIPLSCL